MRYQAYREQCNADSLTMIDAEVPRPGPGQVLVKMRAASLNYRDLF
ncbi:MAG: NAD(P)-dependent alcohol dehydrogenase, partial [Methyloversatilis sp.]|nr:NAD(P)-dependent alcohol dehydrogenase [Methyloversatilis sp.]